MSTNTTAPFTTTSAFVWLANMKKFGLILAALMLCACSHHGDNYQFSEVEFTVAEVVDDPSNWGCVGTDKKAVLEYQNGLHHTTCGYFGKVGSKVQGCKISGHWDSDHNGIFVSHRYCEYMRK